MNILRRLPLSRLLLLCAIVVGVGVSATALASALASGPVPPAEPLAQAVHDAISGPAVQGVSANITLSNRLLEGANLAGATGQGGSSLTSSPLVNGGTGRLWAADGRLRIELQSEQGDTQIVADGGDVMIYDAAANTVYRYTPKQAPSGGSSQPSRDHGATPSLAQVEEALAKVRKHAQLSEATPTDVAGRAAYTVRVSPQEGGSLIGGAELSFDAANGLPLRVAAYSSTSSSPVVELAATEVGYGAVPASVFEIQPPASAKVEQLQLGEHETGGGTGSGGTAKVIRHGHGITSVEVLEATAKSSGKGSGEGEDLPKVSIDGTTATELRTELGTILTFERGSERYVLAAALPPAAVEEVARGL